MMMQMKWMEYIHRSTSSYKIQHRQQHPQHQTCLVLLQFQLLETSLSTKRSSPPSPHHLPKISFLILYSASMVQQASKKERHFWRVNYSQWYTNLLPLGGGSAVVILIELPINCKREFSQEEKLKKINKLHLHLLLPFIARAIQCFY